MATTNYSPGKVNMTFAGITPSGFAKGSFIKVARKTDSFSDDVGSKGDVVRVLSLDKRAEVTFTIQGTSPTNATLYALVKKGEAGLNDDIGAFQLKDLNGTLICAGSSAWLTRPADVEFSDEHTPREWKLTVSELSMDG